MTCVSLLRATFPHIPQACRVHPRPRTIPPPRHDATVAPLRARAAPRRTASLSYCPANEVTKRPSARESRGQPLSAKLRPGPPALCCCPRGLLGAEVTRQGRAPKSYILSSLWVPFPLQLPLRFPLGGYTIGVDSVRSRTLQLLVRQHLCLTVPQDDAKRPSAPSPPHRCCLLILMSLRAPSDLNLARTLAVD